MDKFFDALNVHNFSHGAKSLKPFQMPYTSVDDFRLKVVRTMTSMTSSLFTFLKWIENDFLGYLKDWKFSVENRTGFSKTQKKMMLLSVETHTGLQMTCKKF